MNLSNKLTLLRIGLIPVFLITATPEAFGLGEAPYPILRTIALIVFVGASITDYYDGMLARRHGWISDFGKIVDPLADKLIVMAAFISMVELGIFPAWMVILILCREMLINGLRTLASLRGHALAADRWGKNKTISQMTVVITALVYMAAHDILMAMGLWDDLGRWDVPRYANYVLMTMMVFCVGLTALSGVIYMRKNWALLKASWA